MVLSLPRPEFPVAGGVDPDIEAREVRRLIAFMTLFFTGLIFPYRGVHLPPPALLMIGFVLVVYSAKYAFGDFIRLVVMFTIYAPYSKVLPGDFGYFFRAMNATNVFLIFLFAGWLSRSSMHGERIYRGRFIDIPVAIFIFISSISLIRGEILSGAGQMDDLIWPLKRWLTPFIIFYVVENNIRDRRDIRYVTWAVIVTTAAVAILGLKQFYIDRGYLYGAVFHDVDRIRIRVISGNPNQFGAFLCYYSFIPLAYFLDNMKLRVGWYTLIGFLAAFRAALLTFSRGTSLAFFTAIYASVLLWRRWAFFGFLVPVTIFLACYPQYIPGVFVGRWNHTFQERSEFEVLPSYAPTIGKYKVDRHSVGRIGIWVYGMEIVKAHPLTGVGFGRFRKEIAQLTGGTFDSHNTYLTIAAEMGVPALCVFLWILFLLTRYAFVVYLHAGDPFLVTLARGFLGGLVGLLVSNVFGFRLNSNEIVLQFWILAALVVRAAEIEGLARVDDA